MTLIEYLGLAVIAVLALYIAARVTSAAIFRSKMDYDQRKRHDNRTPKHP